MTAQPMSCIEQPSALLLTGSEVVDLEGKTFGRMNGFWLDISTQRVAYIGVETFSPPRHIHVVPAASCQLEDNRVVRVTVSCELIKTAPTAYAGSELSEVEQEKVNSHYGRFVPLNRTTAIEELRPEESIHSPGETAASGNPSEVDRSRIEQEEQSFLDRKSTRLNSSH